jgi:hypothetical protein
MMPQWFVIHTLSGQEQKVKDSIEKRIKTEEMPEDFIRKSSSRWRRWPKSATKEDGHDAQAASGLCLHPDGAVG